MYSHLINFNSQTSARYAQSSLIEVVYEQVTNSSISLYHFLHFWVRSLRDCCFSHSRCAWCLIQIKRNRLKPFSFWITMFWRMIQANMIFSRSPWSNRRAGCFKILKRDCKIPKAHSTSFLAPSWCSTNNLCFSDYGWHIDLTKATHSGHMPSAR